MKTLTPESGVLRVASPFPDPPFEDVITLSGRLEFETRSGEKQTIQPGDNLLAEDTTGGGHRWRLINDQPWRRAYVAIP